MTDKMVPGCHGAASVFSSDSVVCQRCGDAATCSDSVLATLEQIQGVINVKDLLTRHQNVRAKAKAKQARIESDKVIPPGAAPMPVVPEKVVERKTPLERVTFEVSEEEQALIAMLPKKSQPVAIGVLKSGFIDDMRKALAEKRNILRDKGASPLRVAVDALIANGFFTKSSLSQSLQTDLGWKKNSADSNVSTIIHVMTLFKLIQQNGDRFESIVVEVK